MKKIAILVVGLMLVAAACNKDNNPDVNVDINTPADNNSQSGSNNTDNNTDNDSTPAAPKTYDIKMTNNGFEPSTLTINKGDIVRFSNLDDTNRWPASAPHPTHTDYPQFDAKKAIEVGKLWSFTFDRTGTWKFHDHLIPTMFGSITVK